MERLGLSLLSPAPFIFALRAYHLAGGTTAPVWLGPAMAIVGILSGLGMLLVLYSRFKTKTDFPLTVAAAILAFGGHYGLAPFVPEIGGAFVYLGTALMASTRFVYAMPIGVFTAIAGGLRLVDADMGNVFLVAAAPALGLAMHFAAENAVKEEK